MPVDHYENFPVASFLMPARLRPPVEAIYRFARSADDIADEGSAAPDERRSALAGYLRQLDIIATGAMPEVPLFAALARQVAAFDLPLQPMRDLLSAFLQDVDTARYACFTDLLDYCSRSANPVGRLMLHLYGVHGTSDLAASDAICTALQLINFWQDVAIDAQKGRFYLPQEDLQRFGVSEDQILAGRCDDAFRALLRWEIARARTMMCDGAPLALRLPGRIGWELRLVVQGGLRILERIEQANFDVFRARPILGPTDWVTIAWRALLHRRTCNRMTPQQRIG